VVDVMAQFDMLVAQIKQLQRKLEKAETLEEFKQLTADLKELLELYDEERKRS